MSWNFPKLLLDHFSSEAQSGEGQLFAVALGRRVEHVITVQELIYPPQEGIFEKVIQEGTTDFNI